MKKIIFIIGIILLGIVLIFNIIFTANLNLAECITINFNNLTYIMTLLIVSILIYLVTNIISKKINNNSDSKNITNKVFTVLLIIYTIFNIIWNIKVRPYIVGDSVHVCNLAQTMYRGDPNEFLPNKTYIGIPLLEYMQGYPHQITLAFIYNIFFRITQCDIMQLLRILNIIGNILIVVAIYKINNQLSKTYKTNKILLITLILTFISLPLLTTFVYGDIPSIGLSLLSVYYTMKYTENKKVKYIIIASIFIMLAYMMRMNTLIFIIATVIYLVLNIFKELKANAKKETLVNIFVIILYLIIAIVPSSIVKNHYINKYNLDKNKQYPMISYIFMAMENSQRGNGWYNEGIAEYAIKNPENAKKEYKNRVGERLKYFSSHIGYAIDFYSMKIASMWTENTYSAVVNNIQEENSPLEKITKPLTLYQKSLLIIMCLCTIIILIQNRKNLSIEAIFLLTIFIGGFMFHILWEAKSRYIIPYIITLIPLASIQINNTILQKKT